MERKVLLKCLVGSHNYNLNDESSDKDYKVFVAPTFDDLYFGKMFSNSKIGKDQDLDYHDIRKIPELFWKSNINFVEILYSKEIKFVGNKFLLEEDIQTQGALSRIFDMRDDIVTMNLPYFYNACKGMYFNKMKYLEKGTEGTKHLVEQYGYDTKQAIHAYRVLDFISRFAYTDFKDFKYAIEYEPELRDKMLEIKNGKYTIEQFKDMIEKKYIHFEKFENVYLSEKTKPEVKEELDSIIKEIVRINI